MSILRHALGTSDSMNNPGSVQWTSPYIDKATGNSTITGSITVQDGNKIIGVLGVDILLDSLTTMVSTIELGYDGIPVIIAHEGVAIVHPTLACENIRDQDAVAKLLEASTETGFVNSIVDNKKQIVVYNKIPEIGWNIGAVYTEHKLNETANSIISASSDEQLSAIQKVAKECEELNILSNDLPVAGKKFIL